MARSDSRDASRGRSKSPHQAPRIGLTRPAPWFARVLLRAGLLATLSFAAELPAAEPRVHLEIGTTGIGAIEGPQQWVRALEGMSLASVRLRSAEPTDRTNVEKTGTPEAPVYHVTGLLTSNNELLLPGAKIRYGDKAGLQAWLDKITSSSDQAEATGAFGMSDEQLVALHDRLAPALSISTRGKELSAVLRSIAGELPVALDIDLELRTKVREANAVADELQGLSVGTALAAALRPAALGFAPLRQTDGTWRLRVVDIDKTRDAWPVGWPGDAPPPVLVPKLFEKLEVEIADTPLDKALSALEGRIKIPFVIDYLALDTRQIKMSEIKVRFPAKRVSYLRVIERLLYQAQLEVEVRVDEAHRPFLWIQRLAAVRR